MIKKVIKFLCLLLLLHYGFSHFWQENKTIENTSQETSSFPNPVCDQPLQKIPKYLYDNFNEAAQSNWHKYDFAKLKEFSALSHEEILDWKNTLNLLQSKYMGNSYKLTVSDFSQINAYLTRSSESSPGSMRNKFITWDKYLLSDTELFFSIYLNKAGYHKLLNNEDPFLKLDGKTKEIDSNSIKKLLTYYIQNPDEALKIYPNNLKLDPSKVDIWVNEKTYNKENVINLQEWTIRRIHVFPDPAKLPELLEKTVNTLKRNDLHPIELAALIWYEIIRIQPWNDGNKRTAKAISSLILLDHGYLPPLIKDTADFHAHTLKSFAARENGGKLFAEYIANQIEATQEEFKGNLSTIF